MTVNGLFQPFALVAGRTARMWAWLDVQVTLEPVAEPTGEIMAALASEARDVRRFIGASADPPYRPS